MIKRLRRRFILIAMLTFFTVLSLLVGAINVISYASTEQRINGMLELLVNDRDIMGDAHHAPEDGRGDAKDEHPGELSDEQSGWPDDGSAPELPSLPDAAEGKWHRYGSLQITPETPYETRYFVVEYAADGSTVSCDLEHIAAIGEDDALKYAAEVRSRGDSAGSIGGIYRYYVVSREGGVSTAAFLDCREQLETRKMLLVTSLAVELVCLLAAFVPVLLLSSRAIRPAVESMEKQKRFITDASHEIKTPLAIISANTEVLELTEGSNEWLDSIKNQTSRLTRLVARLVTLSKLDEEHPQLSIADFCISDAVIDAAAPFATVAECAGRRLTLDITPELGYRGDEGAIRQLVSLTVDNAVKYSDDGSEISVRLYRRGHDTLLRVQNLCTDFDRAALPHLFDRFYRADASRSRSTGGYGVGLSVAKAICEAHGGRISADYTEGREIIITAVI